MTFDELVAEVITLTRRPDLVERTQQAVRAATLKAHHRDFFYKDLKEESIEFGQEFYIQNFLPTDIFPNFRKAKYIRFWIGDELPNGRPGPFMTPIGIENSIDLYNYDKTNVFYMAGELLQIRTCAPIKRCLFGAYLHPIITPVNKYCSWIAKEYPFAIIYEAARVIFKSIGMDQQTGEMTQLTAEEYRNLMISNVDEPPTT